MQTQSVARTYARVGLESQAAGASPHQLITMLFDGAAAAIRRAGYALTSGEIAARGMAISKAIDIIERGLRASLDIERGGALAEQLDSLYDYMVRRLMYANRHADRAALDEVAALLEDIASAWRQIG